MTERIVPQRVEPLSDSIDDGSPHLAATDLDLAKGTLGLSRRSAGNRISLSWHQPLLSTERYSGIGGSLVEAPYADLTDSSTWAGFTINNSSTEPTLSIPWYVAESHDYPSLMPRCVTDLRYLSFEVRVQASTFVQAVSSIEFSAVQSHMPFFGESVSDWVYGDWDNGFAAWFQPLIEMKGLNLPSAPRDILLTPQIRLSQRATSAIADVAGTYRVYLSQLIVFDDWEEE